MRRGPAALPALRAQGHGPSTRPRGALWSTWLALGAAAAVAACSASPAVAPSSEGGSSSGPSDPGPADGAAASDIDAGTSPGSADGGPSGSADSAANNGANDDGGSPDGTGAKNAAGDAGGSSGGGVDASRGTDGSSGSFVLSWQDDFNALDLSAWQLESFTYAGNLALFTPQNAAVANGVLTIGLTPNAASTTEPYFGVEMRSLKTLTYGKVSASMRFAHGSGVVSGLVLFYTPFPNCNWNEIDIEHLGGSSNTSQLNAPVFTGTVAQQCTTSVTPTQDPLIVNLGVNAETAFHQYDIEWTPAGVTTSIDGTVLRNWTKFSSLMNLPQNILLTIWASSAAGWAGPLQPGSAPTGADVDWIKVYAWQP